ncbi:hypothetical protein ABZ805_14250 [Saccharopolyspora sp. NPDC047091]|uniref:hypothetical protein n=1 Tax=Saccharopolyspora sp. NPDC047091 TaxID=3155924 RepID=UPI0033C8A201
MSLIAVWTVLLVEFAVACTIAVALVGWIRRSAREASGPSAERARPAVGAARAACR